MLLWWKHDEKEIWVLEHQQVPIPLKEWVLMAPHLRSKAVTLNTIYNAIMKNWANCQRMLAPGQSPQTSFLYHPEFEEVGSLTDFRKWEEARLDKFGNLGIKKSIISVAQVTE